MSKNRNRLPPALTHACFSSLTVLPTESQVEFDKLHRDLVAEYNPVGRSEEIIISNLAKLTWRRENLAIYRLVKIVTERHSSIYFTLRPPPSEAVKAFWEFDTEEETRSPEELEALRKEADEKAQRELGAALELTKVWDIATPEQLLNELSLIERLDGMIARCLKQLLLARGVKSISAAPAEPSPTRLKRIA
jgi:hypothetical protein